MQLVQLQSKKSNTFSVTVRNVEPLLRVTGTAGVAQKRRAEIIASNLAFALVLEAALILFLRMAGLSNLVIYTIPAILVVLLFSLLERRLSPKARVLLLALAAVASVVAAVVLRKYFVNGCSLIMNQLYEHGEMAQSYIYERAKVGKTGESSPEMCNMVATLIVSAMAGIVAAIPPAKHRVGTMVTIFIAAMLFVAYYGILPAKIGIGLIIFASFLLLSKGRLASALPLILATAIIFAVIVAINPGENYAISRADENLRDRIAFGSTLLQNDDVSQSPSDLEFDDNSGDDEEPNGFFGSDLFKNHRAAWIALIVMLPILVIALLIYLFVRKLTARRLALRGSMDSEDDKLATTAMFPYAMRWLKACGISAFEEEGLPYSAMTEQIAEETSAEYGAKFSQMNGLWKLAAYSDHDVKPSDRRAMESFVSETVKLSKEKMNLRGRLRAMLVEAL